MIKINKARKKRIRENNNVGGSDMTDNSKRNTSI